MQTVNYSDYIYYAGTTQPVVRVPVYVYEANTENLASLYDGSGDAIDNPTQTDDNGLFDFWTTFGKYDIYVHNTKEYSVSLLNLAYFYLGIYDANPTERPDGSDLQDGDMYFNSVINHTKLYNNGLWYYADDMMNASGVAYDPASGPQTDVQTQMRDYDTHLDTIDTHLDTIDTHLDNSILNENIDINDDTNASDLGYTSLTVVDGGSFTIASGKTLTIDVPFTAGLYQVFTGDGSVVFGAGSVSKVYPQWWGAKGDGANDDSIALQSALTSVTINGGELYIPTGEYISTNELVVGVNTSIIGEGQRSTILSFTTDTNGLVLPNYVDISGASVSNLKIVGSGSGSSTKAGIYMDTTNYARVDRVSIGAFETGIYLTNAQLNDFHDSTILSCVDGINFDAGSYVNRLYGSTIAGCTNGITGSNATVYAYGVDIEACSGYAVGNVISLYAYGLHIEGDGATSVGIQLASSINHVYYDTDISACVKGVTLPGTTLRSGYAKFTNTTFVDCDTDIDATYFSLLEIENPTFYTAGGSGKSPVVNLNPEYVVWSENKYQADQPYLKNLKYGYYGTDGYPNLRQTKETTGFTVDMGTVGAHSATSIEHILDFSFDPYLEFPVLTFSAYNPVAGIIFEVMMKVGETDTLIIRATNITASPIIVGNVTPTIVFINKRL